MRRLIVGLALLVVGATVAKAQAPLTIPYTFSGGALAPLGRIDANNTAIADYINSRFTPIVNVKDYGAKGDGTTDDTAAIQAAITAVATVNGELSFPPGTYSVNGKTNTVTDESGPNHAALLMASNMHLRATPGTVTLRLQAGCSSDTAPQNCAMFFSNGTLSNLSFDGLILDLNGANNKISPSRPSVYNEFTFAHIIFSGTTGGVAARADGVLVQNCQFLNSPGANAIVLMQSNTVSVTLGTRWRIVNNLFNNNGGDTDDHSSIYGWSDDVLVQGNTFTADTMWGTTGSTGAKVAHEIHGAHHRVIGNTVKNYYQGVWLAENYTSDVKNIAIVGNTFGPLRGIGIDTNRTSANSRPIHDVSIVGNAFEFDNSTTVIAVKAAYQLATVYAVTDVLVEGNVVKGTGTAQATAAVLLSTSGTVASQTHDRITIVGNRASGTTFGVLLTTSNTNKLGEITIANNVFQNLVATGAFANPMGVLYNTGGSQAIVSLNIQNNSVLDTQASPTTAYGIFLSGGGGITNLLVGPQSYLGLVTANYSESGLGSVGARVAPQSQGLQLGSPTGASKGDGTVNAATRYYQNGVAMIQPAGSDGTLRATGFTFANIGTAIPNNGDFGYCSDCTIANPCASGGTGAIAKRLNATNVCN